MINLEQLITFPNLLVDVGHLENPQGFVKLVILSLEPRKPEENGPKIYIFVQVFNQNMEVIGLYGEPIFRNIGLLAAFSPCITR